MKIKELHADIERYLAEGCYCPNEIYSSDGFFYQLFKSEDECTQIGEHKNWIACMSGNQIVIFFKYKDAPDRICDAVRYDATENNLVFVVDMIKDDKSNRKLNRFAENTDKEDLQKVLSLCNGLVIRD